MFRPTIFDLSSDVCKHRHEEKWKGRPLGINTAEYVVSCVRACLIAKDGLNFCAHGSLHRYNADAIFESDIQPLPVDERRFLLKSWKLLNDLKSRVDQLYRFANGGNLTTVGALAHDSNYVEDPRYASDVLDLAEKDTLRLDFLELAELNQKSLFQRRFYALLFKVEKTLSARRDFLIFSAQQRITELAKK